MQWDEIINSLDPLQIKFKQSYKCLNVNRAIKEETLEKHTKILIETFNAIRATLHQQYNRYTTQHKEQAHELFLTLRDKLVKVFHKHNINIKVPLSLTCEVDKNVVETDESDKEDFPTEKGVEVKNIIMPRTEDDVIDRATKIVPVFDGNVNDLTSFLDALTLVDRIKEAHEGIAIEVIKTKLKGHARDLISNENTIQAIKSKLENSVKGESSELLCSKLMNIKQQSKSATAYAEEIQVIAKKLGGAYIREGYPQDIADKLIRQNAAKAISRNASSDEVKLIIKTGNFMSLNEVMSKFVEASTEASTSNASVFYFKRRGTGNGGFNNRGGFHNRSSGGFNNRGRGQGWRRNNNNNGRRGNGNYRNQSNRQQNGGRVRLTQEVSENETSPQNTGGYQQN